jgi:hypothetical protein
MRVRCTSIVDKDVSGSSTDAMNWLSSVLEPLLVDQDFGDGVDQLMVVAVGVHPEQAKDAEIVQSNTRWMRYADPFTRKNVRLLSIALPVGYQRLRALEPHFLRRYVVQSLFEVLENSRIKTPKEFDYKALVIHLRAALG